MIRRMAVFASRATLMLFLGLGIAAVAPASAQQDASNSSAPAQLGAPETQSGPRIREMPRAEARFKDSAAPRYKDHRTTVTISTIVLVIALIVLVLVLI
jgi:hypothetical protein